MIFDILFLIAGTIMLYYGANLLVQGSASLAKIFGITPIVIGLTVVAFGTSAPEIVVSVVSALQDKSMIAVGNVVGSNICNIALVLGITAAIWPVECHRSVIRRDIPVMLGISIYLFILSIDSHISRVEGASLFAGLILYIFSNYYIATGKTSKTFEPQAAITISEPVDNIKKKFVFKQIALIIIGVLGVLAGAKLLIDAAVAIMKDAGVSEKFIGLTIVAFGTSLPELATSVVAALKKQMDISLGNLVGSNVFNILSVLGIASLVRPINIKGGFFASGLFIDYLVMVFISAMPLMLITKTYCVTRSNGLILLLCYMTYFTYLIIKA